MSERKNDGAVAQPVHGDLTDDERAAGFWWGPSGDDDASDVLLSRDGRSLARANERRWEVFEAPWDAKSPSPIAWGSESSRRTNRAAAASEARARGLLRPPPAAPSGLRVAGLLAAMEAEIKEEDQMRVKAAVERRDRVAGEHILRRLALSFAVDLIRAHLGDPTQGERAAAEVLALAPALADIGGGPGTVDEAWRDIGREAQEQRGRDGLLTIAMLAIHGALACDAKGGA